MCGVVAQPSPRFKNVFTFHGAIVCWGWRYNATITKKLSQLIKFTEKHLNIIKPIQQTPRPITSPTAREC